MKQEARFELWFERHQGLVYKVARSYALKAEDLEDLFQEIMLQLWRSIPSFKGQSQESTWIYKVALNTALSWNRKEHNRIRTESSVKLFSAAEISHGHEEREKLDKVYAIIHSLPKAESAVLLLHLEGLSYQEISEVLEISTNLVGVKLHRVRKQINEKFGASNYEHG